MDKVVADKFKKNLENMRRKIIEQKGEGVKGLTPLEAVKEKIVPVSSKTREANA